MIVSDRLTTAGKTAARLLIAFVKYAAGGVALFILSFAIGLWLIS